MLREAVHWAQLVLDKMLSKHWPPGLLVHENNATVVGISRPHSFSQRVASRIQCFEEDSLTVSVLAVRRDAPYRPVLSHPAIKSEKAS